MSQQDEERCIEVHREAGIATITLRRPERLNALTPALFKQLGAHFDEIAANPDDRVMILTGAGEAFCAGADLSGSGAVAERFSASPTARVQLVREMTAPALALHRIPKPTIAAVNGVAAGGGCNLALGCDIIFAAESARFTEIFVNRGLSLDYAGTWLLPRLVGLQRAKDIAFRGNVLDAREALDLGLVLEVIADDALAARVAEYAAGLAAKPPIALSLIKSGLNRATSWAFEEGLAYEAEAQATCMGSDDFLEAISAWAQKRSGDYQGS
ncbi:MAG: enoyl-CoA hydratase/isomerase family protein [Deltaproteobacteria bacterium]|nr:enoyl-CoA hydratase/isomerase family protein [Deltaproteobacteria bacterium]MBW2361686.1 enoyl-CoA hydratase/isomerase family protein [Deltaproteobacteria bacterium]